MLVTERALGAYGQSSLWLEFFVWTFGAVLLVLLAGGAACAVRDWLLLRRILSDDAANGNRDRRINLDLETIDAPAAAMLRDGTIRLVRAAWLVPAATASSGWLCVREAESSAAASPSSTEAVPRIARMRRMQELPKEAFWPPEEAAALFESGNRSVLVLSHRCVPESLPHSAYPLHLPAVCA